MIGIDPGPFTLREMAAMADGRGQLEWGQTSQVLSMLYNANRGKDQKPMAPEAFNPYAVKKKAPVVKVSLSTLAPMIGKRG